MRTYVPGDTVESRFIFIDVNTREPIDVNSPTFTIIHFNGATKVIDLTATSLAHYDTGEYLATWLIPLTAAMNETYFITASGIHPTQGTNTEIEDSFLVVPSTVFSNMVVKFTKD
jgi:hypothetical protein